MNLEKQEYKIALTDDHVLVRTAIANLVNNFEGFKVIIEVSSGEELFNTLDAGIIPDLVLLDINMPGMGGKETAIKLMNNYPDIRILMLSTHATEVTIGHLAGIGVKGFLKKDASPVEFKIAIKSMLELGQYYSGITMHKLMKTLWTYNNEKEKKANKYNKDKKRRNNKKEQEKNSEDCLIITEEEFRFLQLVCTDLTYAGIAGIMKLRSERSAERIREVLFEKLDVRSRSGLVMFAVRNGIVSN